MVQANVDTAVTSLDTIYKRTLIFQLLPFKQRLSHRNSWAKLERLICR